MQPSVLVRHESANKVSQPDQCRLTFGDIGSRSALAATLQDCRAAIYCIGILREDRKKGSSFEALQYEGVVHAVDAARVAGVEHFVLISANGAERRNTPYLDTKYRAEQYLASAGLEYTVFRPSVMFGDPRGRTEFATQLYRQMIKPPLPGAAFQRGWLPSSGPVMLSPLHVTDLVDAIVASIDTPALRNSVCEMGGGEMLSWRTILQRIATAVARKKILLPVPIPAMRIAASLFQWLPIFPVTSDQLKMLQDGNTAPPTDLARLIGRDPRPFSPTELEYLG